MPPAPNDRQELLIRATAGDQQALRQLLVENLPQIEAYLRLQAGAAIRSKESISDLVQSVCGAVLRDLPRFEFRGEGPFRHWLCKHALHKLINKHAFYSAQKRTAEPPAAPHAAQGTDSVLQCYATLCTPSRHAEGREELHRFERAFDQLPDEYREAITLRRIVGLDYGEIAQAMGRSEGAVRNLVHRGLGRLAALLQQ